MKTLFLLAFLLASSLYSFAQTLEVRDHKTGTPLRQVTLISESPKAIALSDSRGLVDLKPFYNSPKILISLIGYETLYLSFEDLKDKGLLLLLKSDNLKLSEVVISGTKWTKESANLPIKISSISSETTEFQNPQTAADLLGLSGKVYVQKSQQGGGSPMIRGFATNRLLYMVDGVRMNSAIFRGGNIQNVINLDPFAIEQTEVLFGPGSVIYGSDAIGGVMSFQTIKPALSAEEDFIVSGKVNSRFSSANEEKTIHADLNLGGKKWASVTSFSHWDYDHLRQGSNGPEDYLRPFFVKRIDGKDKVIAQESPSLKQIPSAYSQYNLMQKIRFRASERWDLEYGFHRSETSPFGRYDRHNRNRNGAPRYAEWNYGPQIWQMNLLALTHTSNRGIFDQMSLKLSHQLFGESRIDRDLNSPIRNRQAEKINALGLNWDFQKMIDEKNTLSYGFEWVENKVNSSGKIEQIETGQKEEGPSRYPQADWTSWGIYLNEELRVNETTNLQAGLRYSRYQISAIFSDKFYPLPFTDAAFNQGAVTGSLGVSLRPREDWVIQANLGTAFRSPNVDDMGKIFDSEPGAVTVPNPQLRAEYAYNLDFGFAKRWGDFAKVDLAAYSTLLDRALVRRDFNLNGLDSIFYQGELSKVQAIQNAAQARVMGLQFGLELQFSPLLSFSTDLNLQRGEEEMDNGEISPSRHAAPFFGVSRLHFKSKQFQAQIYIDFQGERSFEQLAFEEREKDEIYAKDFNGNNYAPAWYTANLKISYLWFKQLHTVFGIENLSDQRYRPYSSGISGPGRNVILSVSYQF